jgi:hypothetical protein
MVRAVKQTVTVGPGGMVEIRSPELLEGSRAEVIVLVESAATTPTQQEIAERLEALDRLQKALNLTPESAEKWMAEIRQEREAFGTRPSTAP